MKKLLVCGIIKHQAVITIALVIRKNFFPFGSDNDGGLWAADLGLLRKVGTIATTFQSPNFPIYSGILRSHYNYLCLYKNKNGILFFQLFYQNDK
ncbi:hypothetical protein [Actinobacillus porcinus]|uniref:hypothetical protein n=1 Tax=Actinobacillus porcinus TaxID=51048 RepID=UPI002A912E26|nr:hypothetical protein [Actinobacillus porcinus]MDY5420983.1 hypothetical protein [Actinobacillus porcinus]